MAYPVPLTSEDWARARYDYECTKRKIVDICSEHGISEGTLRNRVRRWGWKRRDTQISPDGPPPFEVPLIEFQPMEVREAEHPTPDPQAVGPRCRGDEMEVEPSPHLVEDGRGRPFVHDARPIGERLQGAIARVMPALETTLSSLAAGPMAPRQMEQAARALGSLTRTLRELNGLAAEHGMPEPPEDIEALRARVARKLENIIAERDNWPQQYLAGWEEFAAEAEEPRDRRAMPLRPSR